MGAVCLEISNSQQKTIKDEYTAIHFTTLHGFGVIASSLHD